jgi:hypothetical protein
MFVYLFVISLAYAGSTGTSGEPLGSGYAPTEALPLAHPTERTTALEGSSTCAGDAPQVQVTHSPVTASPNYDAKVLLTIQSPPPFCAGEAPATCAPPPARAPAHATSSPQAAPPPTPTGAASSSPSLPLLADLLARSTPSSPSGYMLLLLLASIINYYVIHHVLATLGEARRIAALVIDTIRRARDPPARAPPAPPPVHAAREGPPDNPNLGHAPAQPTAHPATPPGMQPAAAAAREETLAATATREEMPVLVRLGTRSAPSVSPADAATSWRLPEERDATASPARGSPTRSTGSPTHGSSSPTHSASPTPPTTRVMGTLPYTISGTRGTPLVMGTLPHTISGTRGTPLADKLLLTRNQWASGPQQLIGEAMSKPPAPPSMLAPSASRVERRSKWHTWLGSYVSWAMANRSPRVTVITILMDNGFHKHDALALRAEMAMGAGLASFPVDDVSNENRWLQIIEAYSRPQMSAALMLSTASGKLDAWPQGTRDTDRADWVYLVLAHAAKEIECYDLDNLSDGLLLKEIPSLLKNRDLKRGLENVLNMLTASSPDNAVTHWSKVQGWPAAAAAMQDVANSLSGLSQHNSLQLVGITHESMDAMFPASLTRKLAITAPGDSSAGLAPAPPPPPPPLQGCRVCPGAPHTNSDCPHQRVPCAGDGHHEHTMGNCRHPPRVAPRATSQQPGAAATPSAATPTPTAAPAPARIAFSATLPRAPTPFHGTAPSRSPSTSSAASRSGGGCFHCGGAHRLAECSAPGAEVERGRRAAARAAAAPPMMTRARSNSEQQRLAVIEGNADAQPIFMATIFGVAIKGLLDTGATGQHGNYLQWSAFNAIPDFIKPQLTPFAPGAAPAATGYDGAPAPEDFFIGTATVELSILYTMTHLSITHVPTRVDASVCITVRIVKDNPGPVLIIGAQSIKNVAALHDLAVAVITPSINVAYNQQLGKLVNLAATNTQGGDAITRDVAYHAATSGHEPVDPLLFTEAPPALPSRDDIRQSKELRALTAFADTHPPAKDLVDEVVDYIMDHVLDIFGPMDTAANSRLPLVHIPKHNGPPLLEGMSRQIPARLQPEVRAALNKWLKGGFIVPCDRGDIDNVFPLVCVSKGLDENGVSLGLRLCLDLKALNSYHMRQRLEMASAPAFHDPLQGSVIFSALDLFSWFNQMKLDEDSQRIFGICAMGQCYRWLSLPQGYLHASAIAIGVATVHLTEPLTALFERERVERVADATVPLYAGDDTSAIAASDMINVLNTAPAAQHEPAAQPEPSLLEPALDMLEMGMLEMGHEPPLAMLLEPISPTPDLLETFYEIISPALAQQLERDIEMLTADATRSSPTSSPCKPMPSGDDGGDSDSDHDELPHLVRLGSRTTNSSPATSAKNTSSPTTSPVSKLNVTSSPAASPVTSAKDTSSPTTSPVSKLNVTSSPAASPVTSATLTKDTPNLADTTAGRAMLELDSTNLMATAAGRATMAWLWKRHRAASAQTTSAQTTNATNAGTQIASTLIEPMPSQSNITTSTVTMRELEAHTLMMPASVTTPSEIIVNTPSKLVIVELSDVPMSVDYAPTKSTTVIAPIMTSPARGSPTGPDTTTTTRYGLTGSITPVKETPAPVKHPGHSITYTVALSSLTCYIDNLALGTKWSDENVRPTPEMVNEWLSVCKTHWNSTLKPTLSQLHVSGMRIELNKGVWFTATTNNLGYIFDGQSQVINNERMQAIRDLSAPAVKNLESIYKLRGILVSFSRAVGSVAYSESCAVFTALIVDYQRTGRLIKDAWGPQHERALQVCKDEILNAPPVFTTDPALRTHLWTDASTTGWAAVVVQYGHNGYARVNAAFAHAFKDAKLKYPTRHKECYALVAALRKLRQLKMQWRGLIAHCDHSNISFLQSTDDPLLLTWLHELAFSGIMIQHKPGIYNDTADGLSRVGASTNPEDNETTPRLRRVSNEMAKQFETEYLESLVPEARHLHYAVPTLATLLASHASTPPVTNATLPASSHTPTPPVTDATVSGTPPATNATVSSTPHTSTPTTNATVTGTPHTSTSPVTIAAVSPTPTHPATRFMDMQMTFTEKEIESMRSDAAYQYVSITDAMDNHVGKLWMRGSRSVIPASQQLFIDELLHKAHDQAAHPGADTTLSFLGPVYWPSMKADVLAYTSSCPSCQVIKTPTTRGPRGSLRVNNATEPFCTMMVDHIAMTPISESGKTAILHMMCPVSRYSELVAVNDMSASSTLDATLTGWIARHGYPSTLRCDGSKSFEGEFKTFCEANSIAIKVDAPYNPEQRGRLERAHKEFSRMIKTATMQGTQGLWDLAVPQAQMMFNAAINSSLGLSPHEAAFARPFRSATVNITRAFETQFSTREAFIAHAENIKNIVCLADELSSLARAHAYANSHDAAPTYNVGEMILLHTDMIESKLGTPSHWLPGYVVTKVGPEPHMYTVAKMDAEGNHGAPVRANVSRLRKYNATRTPLHGATILLKPGESVFTQIVGHKLLNKSKPTEHLELEVLWANGTRSTAPIADIKATAPAKLSDYITANGIPMASVNRQIQRDNERTSPPGGARGTPSQ